MKLEIISPEKYLFDGEAKKVHLPGAGGVFSILDNHSPLISTLSAGLIRVVTDEETEFAIKDGIIEVRSNKVVICVNQ